MYRDMELHTPSLTYVSDLFAHRRCSVKFLNIFDEGKRYHINEGAKVVLLESRHMGASGAIWHPPFNAQLSPHCHRLCSSC